MNDLNQFLLGASALAFGVAGLFFLRFWRQTQDRLFVIFALAFWLLALTRLGVALSGSISEPYTWLVSVRLVAYLLILLAIADKNNFGRGRRRGEAGRTLEQTEASRH
jgi:hypothetical protein